MGIGMRAARERPPGVRRSPRAFTLIDLLALVALWGVAFGVLAPVFADAQSRRVSNQTVSEERQRAIVQGAAMYAQENKNAMVGFWWQPDKAYSEWDDLNFAFDDLKAAANQAVDIIRRRSPLGPEEAPRISNWIPHVLYSHLVLADFMALDLPNEAFINPEDVYRLCWNRYAHENGPLGWFDRCSGPQPSQPSYRWPYSSSYQFTPACWDRNQSTGGPDAVSQSQDHNSWSTRGLQNGAVRFEPAFPQQKVMLHDSHARHSGPIQAYFALPEAEQPVAFFDGSVRVVRTGEVNEGFLPNFPQLDRPSLFYYAPSTWEAPTLDGERRTLVAGRYRWTRAGLLGVDVGGEETNTGNPGKDDDLDGEE